MGDLDRRGEGERDSDEYRLRRTGDLDLDRLSLLELLEPYEALLALFLLGARESDESLEVSLSLSLNELESDSESYLIISLSPSPVAQREMGTYPTHFFLALLDTLPLPAFLAAFSSFARFFSSSLRILSRSASLAFNIRSANPSRLLASEEADLNSSGVSTLGVERLLPPWASCFECEMRGT
jgi:hypothetical protein